MIIIYTFFSFLFLYHLCVSRLSNRCWRRNANATESAAVAHSKPVGRNCRPSGTLAMPWWSSKSSFLNSFVKHIMICPSALTRFDVECVVTGTVKPRPSSPKRVAAATTASHANCWRCSCVGSRTTSPVSRSWCFSTLRQTTARRTRRRGRWVSSAGGVIEPQQVTGKSTSIKGDLGVAVHGLENK